MEIFPRQPRSQQYQPRSFPQPKILTNQWQMVDSGERLTEDAYTGLTKNRYMYAAPMGNPEEFFVPKGTKGIEFYETEQRIGPDGKIETQTRITHKGVQGYTYIPNGADHTDIAGTLAPNHNSLHGTHPYSKYHRSVFMVPEQYSRGQSVDELLQTHYSGGYAPERPFSKKGIRSAYKFSAKMDGKPFGWARLVPAAVRQALKKL